MTPAASEVTLSGLDGTNPLGFLAALGALDVATRTAPDRDVRLRWTAHDLVPVPVLAGPSDVADLVAWSNADRGRWLRSAVLTGPIAATLTDIKPAPATLHAWAGQIAAHRTDSDGGRPDADLFCGLLAEGAVAGKGDSKPTALHFTAGQQQFLTMVRELATKVDAAALHEALVGPWQRASTLPSLSWDGRGERSYALRGTDPAGEKRTGQPGADWLAFLGLSYLPVFARNGVAETTGCWGSWKNGSFIWPLWTVPISAPVVRSLLSDPGVGELNEPARRSRGIARVLESSILRSDQGGYGSFRPAQPAAPRVPAGRRPRR